MYELRIWNEEELLDLQDCTTDDVKETDIVVKTFSSFNKAKKEALSLLEMIKATLDCIGVANVSEELDGDDDEYDFCLGYLYNIGKYHHFVRASITEI